MKRAMVRTVRRYGWKAALLPLTVGALAAIVAAGVATAQQATTSGSASDVACPGGNVICNGSINFLTTELFFEPETPFASLKETALTWNEIEYLLQHRYHLCARGF